MTNFQKEVLIGCCLGDISIGICSELKKTARFQICQSKKFEEYAYCKFNIFKDLCKTEPKEKDIKYPVIYFNSQSSAELYDFLTIFKCNGKRGVPQNIHKLLTPVSLTYWFCDDGTSSYIPLSKRLRTRSSIVILCTDRYTEQEVELLIKTLWINFKINAKVKHSPSMKNRFRIYIGTNDTERFYDVVEPFMPPSMMYKIKRKYTL